MRSVALAALLVASGAHASTPRSDYLLHCAGCHGLAGRSAPAKVPALVGVGRLMCTAEGRAYAVRLPNVAFARGLDDARLAALLNYVMTVFGGTTPPRPYTSAEIKRLRAMPLTGGGLIKERERVWAGVRDCQPRTRAPSGS
jgi:mono/diheme cytochrome c family protein